MTSSQSQTWDPNSDLPSPSSTSSPKKKSSGLQMARSGSGKGSGCRGRSLGLTPPLPLMITGAQGLPSLAELPFPWLDGPFITLTEPPSMQLQRGPCTKHTGTAPPGDEPWDENKPHRVAGRFWINSCVSVCVCGEGRAGLENSPFDNARCCLGVQGDRGHGFACMHSSVP